MSVDLEAAADALLRASGPLPGVLNERQLRRRQQREVSLEYPITKDLSLSDVLADEKVDADRQLLNWAELEAQLVAADLHFTERAALLLGELEELPDWKIARAFGWDRRTIQRRRKAALEKLRGVVEDEPFQIG